MENAHLKPPKALSFEGNVSENWRRWKQQFSLYMNATSGDEKDEKIQCSILLTVAGEDAVEVFNTFPFTDEEKNKIKPLFDKFENHCTPRKNVTFERHRFNTRNQQTNETIDVYVTDMRKLAKSCEFGELTDSLIKDRIVCGIENAAVRARLLRESELTLSRALDICRAAEISQAQLKDLDKDKVTDVHTVNVKQRRYNTEGQTSNIQHTRPPNKSERTANCGNCGTQHEIRKCPAFGKTCLQCHKVNHFARVCRSAKQTQRRIHTLNETSSDEEEMFIGAIGVQNNMKEWKIILNVNNKRLELKLDSGAQCNVMPYSRFIELSNEQTTKSKTKLVSYSGHRIAVKGKGTLLIQYKGKYFPVEFQLVDQPTLIPVIGLPSCLEMNLIKRVYTVDSNYQDNATSKDHPGAEEIINQYADVFDGLGCLEGEHHIQIDPNVKPVIHPPRKVPFALREKLKEELERMEKLGVIAKVSNPTEWVNSLVVVEKPNGKIRVCLDPRDLNKAIQREHYPMKTIEEIAAELNGANVFSTLDASSGFWQVKLDEESTNLVVFNSPFGRYKFLRLPFGVNSASEVFQRQINQTFEDIEGSVSIVDDILIWGKDIEEHDKRLKQVLQRARDTGLTLNKEKSKIQTSEVTYIGHILTKDGVKPDPNKVKAINEMETPKDKTDLQRFMGMVNYLAKFIVNLSDLTTSLRELLQKDIHWHWTEKHDKEFNAIKRRITSENVLKYYDVSKPVLISVDSSSYGLGACLIQEEQPISYASRSLNKSERNYAQIEKELLAIVFGCNKYHQYIYSKTVTVETDHKPLEFLFKKPLASAPKRLQRMMLNVQKYDLRVVYKPGKHLFIADTLSRAPSRETTKDEDPFQVHTVYAIPVSTEKLEQFRQETEKDKVLQSLKNTVMKGWPDHKSQVEYSIRDYWIVRDEITYEEGILLRGERMIVPSVLRKEMLQRIHENHLGIEKCKRRARDILYWPGMNSQITELISNCSTCLVYRKRQQKEPMQGHEIPDRPWQKVGVDLLEFKGDNYMVLSDYYSKYFELMLLSSTKSRAIIKYLEPQFARFGIPEEVVSDNGPQFSSAEFKEFSNAYGFKHTTSSPRYPQSNGFAERTVQTAKGILKKTKYDGKNMNLALLDLRNTPLPNVNLSPAQILMGRRTRTLLPTKPSLLKPLYNTNTIKPQLEKGQMKQKFYYDRKTKPLQPLQPGDSVRVQNELTKAWVPAFVASESEHPRSYIVESEGRNLRRNRRDIMKTNEPIFTTEKDNHEMIIPDTQEIGEPQPVTDNQPIIGNQRETSQLPRTETQACMNATTTRYGRVVKAPSKLKDFLY